MAEGAWEPYAVLIAKIGNSNPFRTGKPERPRNPYGKPPPKKRAREFIMELAERFGATPCPTAEQSEPEKPTSN